MNKEEVKKTLTDTIEEYVLDSISNSTDKVEMVDVKKGVYIEPAGDESNAWYEMGCIVTWKDADGNYKSKEWILDTFTNDIGDLLIQGYNIVKDISKEIYNEIFEESLD